MKPQQPKHFTQDTQQANFIFQQRSEPDQVLSAQTCSDTENGGFFKSPFSQPSNFFEPLFHPQQHLAVPAHQGQLDILSLSDVQK